MNPTNQELESKYHLSQPKVLEARLQGLGAELLHPRTHEYNLRFDTPDQNLAQEYRLLRLRKDQSAHLTYKGPSTNQSGVNIREEIEITIGDFDTARLLLHALGYVITAVYEKYRTTYELDGLHVTIDEMPFGVFLEIEGKDIESIKLAAVRLGLDGDAHIAQNYLQIFLQLKDTYRLDFDEVLFENFEGIVISLETIGIRPADKLPL
ncbi:MAG: class IV adenylate cyclase [Anaerolineales bacterium]|jgi:adenylate cyclase class 2